MSQVQTTGTGKLTVSQAATQVALHAGTVWAAKLSMGKAILSAVEAGITLVQLQAELKKLPQAELVKVQDVVGLDSKYATGLSKLAKIASVLGQDVVSPDKKHTVTAAQIAGMNLSTEDAVSVARELEKKDGLNVLTLKKYAEGKDGGKSAVKKYLKSAADKAAAARSASPTKPATKKLILKSELFDRVVKAADARKMTVDAYLEHVLFAKS